MRKLRVDLGERSYNIVIEQGILSGIGETLERFEFSKKAALVSNPTVYGLYGRPVATSLRAAGFELTEIIIPDGEEYKNLASVEMIYGEMLKARLDRKSAVIALGGGVVGDIAGFAASTYMRGIDFIQIPTTLLAQVDSSVGGKTGVNHPLGKNMIGAFWQPRLVWIDPDTLKTLPRRELLAGLAEVIKYGVIWDADFFAFIANDRESILRLKGDAIHRIISRSCEVKAEVVSRDEREAGLRSILNFGHTIGHAIETVTGYTRYLHGEAVAIGMHLEARLGQLLGLTEPGEVLRIKSLLESYGLPSQAPVGIDIGAVLGAMLIDKKSVAGDLKIVLPERIGSVRIEKGISTEDISRVFLQTP